MIVVLKKHLLFLLIAYNAVLASDSAFTAHIARGTALFDSSYNAWDKSRFLTTAKHFDNLQKEAGESILPLYWQGVVHFYLVTYHLFGYEKDINKKAAKAHLKTATELLKKAHEQSPDNAEIIALLGTLYGIKIYLDPLSSVVLGKRVFDNINRSLALDSTNPRIYYLVGMSYYHTPGILGGGFKTSREYLLKAETYYDLEQKKGNNPLKPAWGYSTCLSFLGNIHLKKKQYDRSKVYYKKALRVNQEDKLALMGLKNLEEAEKDQ